MGAPVRSVTVLTAGIRALLIPASETSSDERLAESAIWLASKPAPTATGDTITASSTPARNAAHNIRTNRLSARTPNPYLAQPGPWPCALSIHELSLRIVRRRGRAA